MMRGTGVGADRPPEPRSGSDGRVRRKGTLLLAEKSASSAAFWKLNLRRLVEANKKRRHKPLGVKNETGTDDSPSRVCVSGGGTAVMSLLAGACLTQVLARCAPTGW